MPWKNYSNAVRSYVNQEHSVAVEYTSLIRRRRKANAHTLFSSAGYEQTSIAETFSPSHTSRKCLHPIQTQIFHIAFASAIVICNLAPDELLSVKVYAMKYQDIKINSAIRAIESDRDWVKSRLSLEM